MYSVPLTLKSRTMYLIIGGLDHLVVSSPGHMSILLDNIINETFFGGLVYRVVLVHFGRLAVVKRFHHQVARRRRAVVLRELAHA